MADDNESQAKGRIGRVISEKYRIESLLGVGGVAAVFAATHRNGLRVAIKMLHAEHSKNRVIKERFLREGYLANRVDHPGVVRVTDDDVDGDSVYLVMDLLSGSTVEDLNKQGRVDLDLALGIADATLDVLSASHAVSVVHRDIKPSNLFLTDQGKLKALDFGVARLDDSRITKAGEVWGTAAFMAPEQARGDGIDLRVDLWAVGAVLFTLLAGVEVHEGDNDVAQVVNAATKPARPLRSLEPGVPRPLAEIVDRALAFNRNDRWPTAREMQAALREAYRYKMLV